MSELTDFLAKYNFTESQFKSAKIPWKTLKQIRNDFKNKRNEYIDICSSFMEEYIEDKSKDNGLHSYSSRVKDPDHLISKIVRKLIDNPAHESNYQKYKEINERNYTYLVTDLIGVKGLLLYREDWIKLHKVIENAFKNPSSSYIVKDKNSFDKIPNNSMIEKPVFHLKKGDNYDLFSKYIGIDFNIDEQIRDNSSYRSIHYILKYKDHIIELQVRTLFDEGWGEVDHDLLYPNRLKDKRLTEFSAIMSTLTGMANEMSSYFFKLVNGWHSEDDNGDIKSGGKKQDSITKSANPDIKSGSFGETQLNGEAYKDNENQNNKSENIMRSMLNNIINE